jgi:hypothetical protein
VNVAASHTAAGERPSIGVRIIQFVLVANAIPAFFLLTVVPGRTADLFVWTVKPDASARLLAAMYGNAAILVLMTLRRKVWSDIRVAFVVFILFSWAATIVTFLHLDPFLAHPRYFFAYWLVNYFFLFLTTPVVFALEERAHGGRLTVTEPLPREMRVAAILAALTCLVAGASMLAGPGFVNDLWPWPMTPLVARIIGVWLSALGAAYAWALWDGDVRRSRPIFAQGLPTAVLVGIVPLAHRGYLAGGVGHYILFAALVGTLAVAAVAAVPRRRTRTGKSVAVE